MSRNKKTDFLKLLDAADSSKVELMFWRLPEVKLRTGLSRTSVYRLEAEGEFPPRVRLAERTVAWRRDQVEIWLKSRPVIAQHEASAA